MEQRIVKSRREKKPKYSKAELRMMLKTNSCPQDAPKEIHDALERRRLKRNREEKNPYNEMDDYMYKQYGAEPFIPVRPGMRGEIITYHSRRGGLMGLATKLMRALYNFLGRFEK